MELIELQNLFEKAILDKDETSRQRLYQQIKAPSNLSNQDGLAIYNGSIFAQLIQTLKSIYPVCHSLVGDKFFEGCANIYAQNNPSTSPDLGDYGESFPQFLAEFKHAQSLPYLPDVAKLEWHWHRVYIGLDSKMLDIQALGKVPQENWGEIIFSIPENSILIESIYPIHRIWEISQPDYEGDEGVNLDEGGIKIFLWRQDYDMRMDFPSDEEWYFLQALSKKVDFGEVCFELERDYPSINVGGLLPIFVQRGWIESFTINE